MKYNWQQPDWTKFSYSTERIEDMLFEFAEETGHISGMLKAMPEKSQIEAILNTMVAEAIKTSEIEGEYLSRQDVVSSIRNNLGLNIRPDKIKDKKAQGAGKLMVMVRESFAEPLAENTLFEWHKILMGDKGKIKTGAWRTRNEPMQVISGSIGKEKVHFEAPPSRVVKDEMKRFIQWFNSTAPKEKSELKKAPVRAAIAHLYFETLHPFEDGNGRIGRAIAEKALSQTIGRPVLLSLSQTIEANKKMYYAALEQAQRSNEITDWVIYFIKTLLDAQVQAKILIDFTLNKTNYFDRYKEKLNDRQLKAIERMFEAGPKGFEGGMTAGKYMAITKVSKATATRDLQLLADIKAFRSKGAGRSSRYELNL